MVGRAILRQLQAKHPDLLVRASCFRQSPDPSVSPRVTWVQGDLQQRDTCLEMCRGCDIAIMAAALTTGTVQTARDPWQQVSSNLLMNLAMLQAFQQAGVQKVIFISSASVYQEFQGAVREDQLDDSRDPHPSYFGIGWTLRYLEKFCEFWHRTTGADVTVVRAANIYGPFAKFNPAVSNFIPALIRKAVERQNPFEVWGSPDITRDVIYADDFADAIIRLLDFQGSGFDIFNVGSSQSLSVGDAVKWILHAADHHPDSIQFNATGPSTIQHRLLDCNRIQKATGWKPTFSLQQGIENTVAWWKENRYKWMC